MNPNELPLEWIDRRGDREELILQFLNSTPELITPRGWSGADLLVYAVSEGMRSVVEELLRRGVDPNGRRSDGLTWPLLDAAMAGDLEMVRLLLAAGAEPSHPDLASASEEARCRFSSTPAHWAATHESLLPILEALLESGAMVDARDADGWTPLHGAARAVNVSAAQMLLGAGADPDAADDHGGTPAAIAAHHRDLAPVFGLSTKGRRRKQ